MPKGVSHHYLGLETILSVRSSYLLSLDNVGSLAGLDLQINPE